MANIQKEKTPMPMQNPEICSKNFNEVALGYTDEMAVNEANRCLNCKNKPCVNGCPVGVDIPDFISYIKENDFEKAFETLHTKNLLPAICGRVCPQEKQCESFCVRGKNGDPVGIGRLERFVADKAIENNFKSNDNIEKNGHRVAVIGSGPAGLSCAGELCSKGYDVTIYEALHASGGVLIYGIPEFRLPKALVANEIKNLKDMGVKIVTNVVIGRTISLDELFEQEKFEAVFIGSGAGLPRFQGIPGEELCGVFSANEFLTRINLMKAYKFPEYDTPIHVGKKVAVIGGGNVAMDASRCAVRMGAEEVYIIYRRSENELPARKEEVEHAHMEGVQFKMLTNPTRIIPDENGFVKAMECVEMELGEPDASGRRRPVVKSGSEFVIDVDTVIIAIGNTPNPLIASTTEGLDTQSFGGIVVHEGTCKTTRKGVYAGGDAVTGAATVILAMGAGKQAANEIDEYLKNK